MNVSCIMVQCTRSFWPAPACVRINVTTYKSDTDKRSRVIAQRYLFAEGSVRFPWEAAWLEEFTAELLAFPGSYDDQADALIQAFDWSRNRRGEVSVGFARGIM